MGSSPKEGVPNGQSWDKWGMKKSNGCNWLKQSKYVKIHESILIHKKGANKTNLSAIIGENYNTIPLL